MNATWKPEAIRLMSQMMRGPVYAGRCLTSGRARVLLALVKSGVATKQICDDGSWRFDLA